MTDAEEERVNRLMESVEPGWGPVYPQLSSKPWADALGDGARSLTALGAVGGVASRLPWYGKPLAAIPAGIAAYYGDRAARHVSQVRGQHPHQIAQRRIEDHLRASDPGFGSAPDVVPYHVASTAPATIEPRGDVTEYFRTPRVARQGPDDTASDRFRPLRVTGTPFDDIGGFADYSNDAVSHYRGLRAWPSSNPQAGQFSDRSPRLDPFVLTPAEQREVMLPDPILGPVTRTMDAGVNTYRNALARAAETARAYGADSGKVARGQFLAELPTYPVEMLASGLRAASYPVDLMMGRRSDVGPVDALVGLGGAGMGARRARRALWGGGP